MRQIETFSKPHIVQLLTAFLKPCMKTTKYFLSLLLLLGGIVSGLAQTHTPRYVSMAAKTNAYYEYLPEGYDPAGTATYPLILFLTGIGEFGNGSPTQLPNVLEEALPKEIENGRFPKAFTVGGEVFRFIVITPQFIKFPRPTADDIDAVLNYVVTHYKVDLNRIYLTGISYGGGLCWAYPGAKAEYAKRVAAIVPVASPVPEDGNAVIYTRSRTIAANNVAVWATHNRYDQVDTVATTIAYIDSINQPPAPNPPAKMTIFEARGHDAWTKTYNPDFRENGLNVYEWMLQYRRNIVVTNQPPKANAGADITITFPTNTATLSGSGTDVDGTIASYSWTQMSGPSTATIASPNAASTTVSSLTAGTYVFRLTVKDDKGATATDDVSVVVNAAPNKAPQANAGGDQTITLPANSVTLNGSGTDSDGSIASYAWTKVSGPAGGTISTPAAKTTTITALQQGSYIFRLTVTDNSGATASDELTITVNAAPNQTPTANAGGDQVITLPANSITVSGTGTDPDGTIASYVWTKVSGPQGGAITNPAANTTTVTGLQQGSYVFRLTVTDNKGATAADDVTITVNPAPVANQPPQVAAGADQTITLPESKVTLTGTATDADGSIVQYAWTKTSGPAGGTIATADKVTTAVSGLTQGVYVFRLTVKDDDGATAQDEVTITVNSAANKTPVATAGADQTITLPVNSVNLSGSGTDEDGTIASYLWTKVSGPAGAVIVTNTAAATQVTGLVQGTYVFRLSVTDNKGVTATDDVTITVKAAPNQAPVANAGADVTITLPTNTATLSGSGTDADGTIASYAWSKVSGPAAGTIASSGTAQTAINNLTQGTYTFRLTVTDNAGASAADDITVTVLAAPANKPPVADAGPDQKISLPADSTVLRGTGTDSDGSIASYQWTKASGPGGGTLVTPNVDSTLVTGLKQGTYVFRLTVTDNSGATASNDVSVEVNVVTDSVEGPTVSDYRIIVAPNPSTTSFSLKFLSPNAQPAYLRITDALGRVVAEQSNVQRDKVLTIGQPYPPGVYFAEVVQDGKRATARLLKLR